MPDPLNLDAIRARYLSVGRVRRLIAQDAPYFHRDLHQCLAVIEALREALDDSTSLLKSVRDENDAGGLAEQIRQNCAALALVTGGKDANQV